MRPYEYHSVNYSKCLNNRLSEEKSSLGLLCSFRENVKLAKEGLYRFGELKNTIEKICRELSLELSVVGENLNSCDWMEKVMELVLEKRILVIDISDPRPNVLYELGIAASLRDDESVVIIKNKNADFESSEILQLQLLNYNDLLDLEEKLKQHFHSKHSSCAKEVDYFFKTMHERISPGAMHQLKRMINSHIINWENREADAWHISYDVDSFEGTVEVEYTKELLKQNLVRYDYGKCKNQGRLEWALHPTTLGKNILILIIFWSIFIRRMN